ncbi:MAG: endonuclease/exonuclease/phosphatase family protein [Candidatus Marinimicrobia bacterium]|nr:endonuclease/exonuclease/phosphatase family protein [Candidatus Neomarinimicrobiota bacterium]
MFRINSLWLILFFSCRSLVTTFEDVESAIYYEAVPQKSAEFNNSLKVMTWNIRFGAGRIPFFGDSCGDRVLMTKAETKGYLNSIVSYINLTLPDILLLQEVDVSSKRSAYVNQLQYILDRTHLNYGTYASMWDAEIVPSDGLGKVDAGNAVLSRWKITDAERIQLPLRTDQDALTQYFYLRRNILKAKIDLPLENNFYAVNTHATAFATDDTKQKHIDKYEKVLEGLYSQGFIFVTGGDLNSVPPGADPTDFCEDDSCSDESFHIDADGGPHREGSYFNNFPSEPNLVEPFYSYSPAINLDDTRDSTNYTHSPWNTNANNTGFSDVDYWDRKLDYLFTNFEDGFINGTTHQDAHELSDHAPVSATLTFPSQ